MMDDPRERFVERIDIGKTRVKPFAGFIILCGGPHDAEASEHTSLRNLVWKRLTDGSQRELAGRIRMAEDITDWFLGDKYKDLLTFEEHLASLAAAILLVVESPGSIAELGSFAVIERIAERLITIVPEVYYEQDSFIRLGPVKRLQSLPSERVLVFKWHDVGYASRLTLNYDRFSDSDVSQVIEEIEDLVTTPQNERVFKAEDPLHVMLLLCELCHVFRALTESELIRYLAVLAPAVSRTVVAQYLFLLEKCQIINLVNKGRYKFFVVREWTSHIILSSNEGRLDRERTMVDVTTYYSASHKPRFEVISAQGGKR